MFFEVLRAVIQFILQKNWFCYFRPLIEISVSIIENTILSLRNFMETCRTFRGAETSSVIF